jgi:tight adherence protein C
MALIISALLFMLLMLSISLYGYRRYARPGRFYEQLGTELISVSHPDIDPVTGLVVRVIKTIGEKVPISPESASSTRRELIAAGYRSDSALLVFYGAKVLFCSAMILLAFVAGDYLFANPLHRILFTALGGFIGYFAPSLFLERLVTNRQERLRLALPDALDLLVISVEAGLGLDQALQYVSREMVISNKELADELSLVTLEMRAGKRRAEALRNLSDRTGEPELRKLVAILIQTDRFGTSMAESLRVHSDFMRVRRRQEAEERAGKVGVKLVFPIFFFIMPSIFVVAAGPGMLQIFKYLFPMMRQFQ